MLFASARGLHAEREYLPHRFLSITVVPLRWDSSVALIWLDVLLKRKKAESEAQRGKPKGTLESEIRNAISEWMCVLLNGKKE